MSSAGITAADLAALAIRVLDTQQEYFKDKHGTPRKQELLVASKQLEAELRRAAQAIMRATPTETQHA